jgi:hypothetical protein
MPVWLLINYFFLEFLSSSAPGVENNHESTVGTKDDNNWQRMCSWKIKKGYLKTQIA